MIPMLLWRCPLCTTNDALTEKRRLRRPLEIHCNACGTVWRVRREVGVDYWLRVAESPAYPDQVGTELKSGQWYARMKSTVALDPIEDPSAALGEGEKLYLVSQKVALTATADNPYFFDQEKNPARDGDTSVKVGRGQVLLSSHRLIWEGLDGTRVPLQLTKLNSVYALRNQALILLYEMHLLSLRFPEESLLKWLTYFSKVAGEVKRHSGHVITTSRF